MYNLDYDVNISHKNNVCCSYISQMYSMLLGYNVGLMGIVRNLILKSTRMVQPFLRCYFFLS